ncbi:MAG: hypothetical protein CFE45_25260 [Burkholderiales bacterium PBB5]|nr:MAG: hypothetical protein CFE45_25260 [Burkholderiales bacterium PBB5]
MPAEEVKALLDSGADVVVLDARRFDEYQTMCIPGGTSVPGAELALRVRDLAPNPATRVIVNCAGRTRSIIGTQSLVNAGIPNPVSALRNGTIGWTLAGLKLDHGQQRRFGAVSPEALAAARSAAQTLADRAGAVRLDTATLAAWVADGARTLYRWDVRTPEEYAAGHLPGFGSAPGGQLVQETDVCAAVRGARIALADGGPGSDGVRAAMTAHWLAQLGWEVGWLTDNTPDQHTSTGPWRPAHAPQPEVLRTDLPTVLGRLPAADRIVLTCPDGRLARLAAADLHRYTAKPLAVLDGGTPAWVAAGLPLETGDAGRLSERIDRYRRPYEGTDAPREAMQAYLDWEFGLVAQLGRAGTHHFQVLPAA